MTDDRAAEVSAGAGSTSESEDQRRAAIRLVRHAVFNHDADFIRYHDHTLAHPAASSSSASPSSSSSSSASSSSASGGRHRTFDYIFATPEDPHLPRQLFDRLRWGGQFIFVASCIKKTRALARLFQRRGYLLDIEPRFLRTRRFGLPIGPRIHYFVARKVLMVPPGEFSDRFTYHVHLRRSPANADQYVVVKEVPDIESLRRRLLVRFPEQEAAVTEKQARTLAQTIFPVFLTREAAFIKILQRDLPEAYRPRVPQVVAIEKDDRGYVRRLELNWMRKAIRPMSHLDFAIQSADLLMQLHERARIIHLDLRLDNFVITDDGVGFVDYGSSARVGENIAASPFLNNLFTEIMRTSQIQRMLEKMATTGAVTSELITGSRQKVDKAVDLFYLAVQIEKPHVNPYIRELVNYDPASDEATLISELCQQVLRPADPKRPRFNSARDVLAGLTEIREKLGHNP
jgi:hypothetical protein